MLLMSPLWGYEICSCRRFYHSVARYAGDVAPLGLGHSFIHTVYHSVARYVVDAAPLGLGHSFIHIVHFYHSVARYAIDVAPLGLRYSICSFPFHVFSPNGVSSLTHGIAVGF
jgi:hypothetical protein